ncbi:Rgg/GadR/MutR family transcriptional regulator [Schleiferilactobacillus shenzhenensis]|uniref:HTH cro/C1-type domain-containing protein n=1 Tax=Schleiferilactobacillus shenzhenensis LY-73 TaxID=1231336 RepID=U4THI3_9LACO|nr:Rgg/GadR/MutR family transcriptional regulator [Schleiferilactobacillus shenzhenensis]ERL64271.1 hypothetical protein L248_1454 [Schleiferilactobacillus shenzhenensis LY-73]
MMTTGAAVRRIRLDKHMTLREAAGDAISLAQLSRFETDQQDLGINVLLQVLDNLHTTLTEMRYLQLDGTADDPFTRIVDEIRDAHDSSAARVERARLIYERYRHDFAHRMQRWVAGGIWLYLTHDTVSHSRSAPVPADIRQRLVGEVHSYLGKVGTWGGTELQLYNIYSFNFADDELYALMQPALRRGESYIGLFDYYRFVPFILNTNLSIFVSHNRLDLAEATLHRTAEFLQAGGQDMVSPRVFYIFNQGLVLFKKGQPVAARQKCSDAIRVAEMFNETETVALLQQRLQNWLQHYQEPGFTDILI